LSYLREPCFSAPGGVVRARARSAFASQNLVTRGHDRVRNSLSIGGIVGLREARPSIAVNASTFMARPRTCSMPRLGQYSRLTQPKRDRFEPLPGFLFGRFRE